jgi:hypothetical protein
VLVIGLAGVKEFWQLYNISGLVFASSYARQEGASGMIKFLLEAV